MSKIFIFNNGCEQRSLDSWKFFNYFKKNNHIIVDNQKDADIIFFMTCAFIDIVAQASLEKVKEFQKYDAELIVAGCLPLIDKEKLSKIFNGRTIGTYCFDKDPDRVDYLFPEHKVKFSLIKDENKLFPNPVRKNFTGMVKESILSTKFTKEKIFEIREYVIKNIHGQGTSAHRFLSKEPCFVIRISWGCYGNCTYCGIKKAIGTHKSKPIDECVEEFKKGLNEGYKRFLLTSDDTGAYGLDIGSSLPELLTKLTQIDADYEIEIYNIHPEWIVKYIDELEQIINNKKIPYLESPLTHGSPRVLKLMGRYSDIEKMKNSFVRLKKANPSLQLFANIIIGFPTEELEDLYNTIDFIKGCNFDSGFVYKFSCRSGTKAEEIKPVITEKEKSIRLKIIKKIMKKSGFKEPRLAMKQPFFYFEKRV